MPAWLLTMQEDDGWRRTLIELAREHRQSAFLRFVLKQLSDNGYHREIAAVISETDLFSVFNGEGEGQQGTAAGRGAEGAQRKIEGGGVWRERGGGRDVGRYCCNPLRTSDSWVLCHVIDCCLFCSCSCW